MAGVLILASASPARKELLEKLGYKPDLIIPADINEDHLRGERPFDLAKRLAACKARAIYIALQKHLAEKAVIGDYDKINWFGNTPQLQKKIEFFKKISGDVELSSEVLEKIGQLDLGKFTIIAADTVVSKGAKLLPKALSDEDVRICMETLSGGNHNVYTGLCAVSSEGVISKKVVATRVKFKNLTKAEIDHMVESKEGIGKAGGWTITGYAESFIQQITGSYSNVIGLPSYQVLGMIKGLCT